MSTTLNILCPNGRRSQVKVQANTKVLEIIEEVCKKNGFDSNEYALVHHKKQLDITLSFRLTGVPNNGHLELQKLEGGPRTFADVILVLQLDDGSRLSAKSFSPNSTYLNSILTTYKNESELIEVAFNQDLAKETDTYPIMAYLNEQVVGLNQLENTTLKDLGLINGRGIIRFGFKNINRDEFDKIQEEFNLKLSKKLKLDQTFQKILEDQVKIVEQESVPMMEKQESFEKPTTSFRAAVHSNYENQVKPVKKQISNFGSISLEPEPMMPTNEFLNFKFPEETKGKNLNNINELAEMEKESREACDRLAVFYNMEENRNIIESDVPDDFFEHTHDDIKYMLNDLKRIQNEESVLMTKQMRELEQDKKAMKYSKVAIRICFKNRQVLQGLFRPKELVSTLYKFVKQSFTTSNNSKDDLDFTLTSDLLSDTNNENKKETETNVPRIIVEEVIETEQKRDNVTRKDSINCVPNSIGTELAAISNEDKQETITNKQQIQFEPFKFKMPEIIPDDLKSNNFEFFTDKENANFLDMEENDNMLQNVLRRQSLFKLKEKINGKVSKHINEIEKRKLSPYRFANSPLKPKKMKETNLSLLSKIAHLKNHITNEETENNDSPSKTGGGGGIFSRKILKEQSENEQFINKTKPKNMLSTTIATSTCSPKIPSDSPLIARAKNQFYKKFSKNRSVKRLNATMTPFSTNLSSIADTSLDMSNNQTINKSVNSPTGKHLISSWKCSTESIDL
jgi:tether containing UBX domain for GLUT4